MAGAAPVPGASGSHPLGIASGVTAAPPRGLPLRTPGPDPPGADPAGRVEWAVAASGAPSSLSDSRLRPAIMNWPTRRGAERHWAGVLGLSPLVALGGFHGAHRIRCRKALPWSGPTRRG